MQQPNLQLILVGEVLTQVRLASNVFDVEIQFESGHCEHVQTLAGVNRREQRKTSVT